MRNGNLIQMLREVRLFDGCSSETLEKAACGAAPRKLGKGEEACADGRELLLVCSGKLRVGRNGVRLNVLRPGDVTGVSTLFGSSVCDTDVTAAVPTEVIAWTREQFEDMMLSDPVLLHNYLSFLSDRICFLNKKIAFFTAGGAEEKVTAYLLSVSNGQARFRMPQSMAAVANLLDIGRASLYRVFDSLEEKGKIRKEGAQIEILAPQLLEKLNQPEE
ncbi:MAG: Crp/Fnr family transcriptional regulator [Clostridia bacterium]|nr:Crp/Fnr family transcriptional regulator [Clostridia bacterium]